MPAFGYLWLNRLYDPLVGATMPERRIKMALIGAARAVSGSWVLDVGCGTGTLLLLLRKLAPGALALGIDPDPSILAIAKGKAARHSVALPLAAAMAQQLPFASESFDRVLTTFALHHMTLDAKRAMLSEARRVLRPGGELHIADFGRPHTALMSFLTSAFKFLHGAEEIRDNYAGRIPQLCLDAGFAAADETDSWRTAFGTVSFYQAIR